MAIKRLTIEGYGQVELNNVAFRRDGRIEAQCKPGTSFDIENGMLLTVDRVAREIVAYTSNSKLPVALVYTAEHMYDERRPGLNNFVTPHSGENFLPRVGYISVGELFTTNTVCYDTTEFAAEANLKTAIDGYKTTALYGGIGTTGAIKLSATAPQAGPVLQVVEKTTMPDGTLGLKFQVLSV